MMKMSFSEPYRILIIFAICLCFVLPQAQHLSDEQLREIAKLRAELSAAFEAHEDSELMSEGVVVQPGWTQSGKAETAVNAKVVVTDVELAEIKRLRAEILKAVDAGSYAAGTAKGAKHMQRLQKAFGLQHRSKAVLNKMLGSKASATEEDEQDEQEAAEQLGAVGFAEDVNPNEPNIIEASDSNEPDIDIRKLQSLDMAKRRTKDVMRLEYIVEDLHFTLGEDVLEWSAVWHDGNEYFVGRREHDLLIVRVGNMRFDKGGIIDVGQTISYMESFSFWNVAQQQQEGVLLVATADKVIWYRYNSKTRKIETYWEWSTGRVISGLTYFTIDSHQYLVVSTNESSRSGYFNLNIYQFVLQSQEFWIVQRLQLQQPCAEVTVHDTGRDILLAVAQHNRAAVYCFNPRAVSTPDYIHFELQHNFESEGIEFIAAFKMGGRSYLALGGMQPQILLYQQGQFVQKTIFGQNFGLVELFFPIPVRTYRDDLILLVQHRVDFSTHALTVLETLIWNGESFEANIPVPCHLGAHTAYGVSCMLDMQREEGLKGATLLKREDELAILVPRFKAESGLFYLHTEILQQNSELLDLQDIYGFLKDWVKEQDDLLIQTQTFLAQPQSSMIVQTAPDFTQLELLKTPELRFFGEIGELYINDYRWTEEDAAVSLNSLIQKIQLLGRDIFPSRQRRNINGDVPKFDALAFDVVEVEELLLEKLNNAPFYIKNGELSFEGILNMHSLQVLEQTAKDSRANSVDESYNLELDGDISFETINGIPWEDIKSGLVFRNEAVQLKELQVDGEVIVEDDLSLNYLNELKFPDDLLWSSGPLVSTIRAEKTFTGSLAANAVDIAESINGVNLRDVITLTEAQNWTGLVTFANLEIMQGLELNGTDKARNLEHISSNPTLLDSNSIQSACNFAHLEVNGDVIINGRLVENNNLPQLLADIVQRPASPEQRIDIASPKKFSTVEFPVDFRVDSNQVNDIETDEFVTLHTSQELDFDKLSGYVYFNNLTLSGTYDGVKIAELLQNSIKIDEAQVSTDTQLNFVDTFTAAKVEVLDSLNSIPLASGYQTVLENLVAKELNIDDLHAKLAQISGDIQGDGTLNGRDLAQFFGQRSWTESTDGGNIFLDELTLQAGLHADALHGLRAEYLFNFLDSIDELPEMILDGKIEVDHVIISGDVQVSKLNGDNFDEDIQLTVVWLNRPNYLSTNLKFEEPLELLDNIYCEGTLNGEYLPDLIEDMVFRSTANDTLRVTAPKKFLQNIHVSGNLRVAALNGILFEKIATKQNIAHLAGNLRLTGNMQVTELELLGDYLNGFDWNYLSSRLSFDAQLDAFVLRGETLFDEPVMLQDLSVQGDFDSFTNISGFFDNLVYKNSTCLLKGKNTFKGRVAIEKGAYVDNLNGLNLLELLNSIVFISEKQPVVIKSPLSFLAPVKAGDVTIRESLMASNLNDCSLQAWLEDSLRVDRDENISKFLHFSAGALDGNAFFASFLNDIDLSKVITLHSSQNLTDDLELSEVYLDVALSCDEPINGVNLQAEYDNTLLIHGDQHIKTPLTMQSCHVLGELLTKAAVNSAKDLRQVALLHESLEFRSPLFLQNITARNLYTNDLVSGINLDQWHKTALWLTGRTPQWITGNWSVRSLNVQAPNDRSLAEGNRSPRADKSFLHVCQRVAKLLQKRATGICFVKYIEEAFELRLPGNETIRQVFAMSVNDSALMLLNSGCFSQLYKWNGSESSFKQWNTFESGNIDQLLMLATSPQNSTLAFVTNDASSQSSSNCSLSGLNSWSLQSNKVKHLHSLGHNYTSIHQPHPPPSTHFYAHNKQKHLIHEFTSPFEAVTNTWKLRLASNESSDVYRFLPAAATTSNISLSNGQQIFVLIKNNAAAKIKRSSSFRLSLPLVSLDAVRKLKATSESLLNPPNDTAVSRKLDFSDFEQVVIRILYDLNWRLSMEINITQLSIPESDLYDIHLVQDFIDIMQELKQQQIFPPKTFADIKLEKLQLPVNPAQVLAARTVQIIWPVIVEIEEVHSYLKEDDSHSHPVCARIVQSLGFTVRDVLLLAYKRGKKNTSGYMKDMMAVIKRIRKLQANLDVIVSDITMDIERKLSLADKNTTAAEDSLELLKTRSSFDSINGTQMEFNETLLNSTGGNVAVSLLPADWLGEAIIFEAGSAAESRTMTAVISLQSHLSPGSHDIVKLYASLAGESKLFQTVLAQKPHALVSLRIRDETLLAFVESCCTVRVLIYRGIQGFGDFVKFATTGTIHNMISFSLGMSDSLEQRHFIAANMAQRVQFFEAILAGDKHAVDKSFKCA